MKRLINFIVAAVLIVALTGCTKESIAELFKVSTDYILGLSNGGVISTASLTEEQTKILFTLVQYFNRENEKNG